MSRVVSRLYTDYLPTARETTHASRTAAQRPDSKRVFVARVPSFVSEDELRQYFESFGAVEDAYRPRDFAKNTFRGIGFVTFADPCAVDVVISRKHQIGGVEVVVDRATPKEASNSRVEMMGETSAVAKSTEGVETKWKKSFPPAGALANNYAAMASVGGVHDPVLDANFFRAYSAPYPNSTGNSCGPASTFSDDFSGDMTPPMTMRGEVYDVSGAIQGVSTPLRKMPSGNSEAGQKLAKLANPQAVHSPAKNERNQKLTDNLAHVRKVRGGPRIFVGKLSKDTVEQDLADHFGQFGFVMDVYIPRSRDNKKEHRGFGFVTFETEASIKRAISQGMHQLKGATLAIDVAVPENPPSNN